MKAPGFQKYPQHRVETRPASGQVRVTYRGEVIADTRGAVELHESFGEGKKPETRNNRTYKLEVGKSRKEKQDKEVFARLDGGAVFALPIGPTDALAAGALELLLQGRSAERCVEL